MKIEAPGKINLTLNVKGRRPDGYHDLDLIFQPVSLVDTLTIEKDEERESGLTFTCNRKDLETADNLVCRTYTKMREQYPQIGAVQVYLEKRIPSGAGMGGGSTDAAALILALDEMFGLNMKKEEKIRLGATLGADVPACLLRRASHGLGIGDQLMEIETALSYPLLILKPSCSFSTAEMYKAIDEAGDLKQIFSGESMKEAMEKDDLQEMAKNLYNVFEDVVPERELIQKYKQMLREHGALGALMTGSGSCVFGLFEDVATRDRAYATLKEEYDVYSCEAINR